MLTMSPLLLPQPGPKCYGRTTSRHETMLLVRMAEVARSIANPPPIEINYCYRAWQDPYRSMKGMHWYKGMINPGTLKGDGNNR